MVPSGIEESLSASFFSDMIDKEREGMGSLVWKLQRQITKWASLILHSQVTDAFFRRQNMSYIRGVSQVLPEFYYEVIGVQIIADLYIEERLVSNDCSLFYGD